MEEIALIKIIKDNAAQIWENYQPVRKVEKLEEWRE
jgi:GAF domain-containing protein